MPIVPALTEQLLAEYHRALGAIINGDPDVYKAMFTSAEDVTLANPFGPVARGRAAVEDRVERAARNYADGELTGFDEVARYETAELAYLVEVERFRARVGGRSEPSSIALRVTTIFRCEDGDWKVVHRHADPITGERPAESVIAQ